MCFQVGLHKFVPRAVLDAAKPKSLRKMIQAQFKRVAQLSEPECMFKFFDLLRTQYMFHQEKFVCTLGVRYVQLFIVGINKFLKKICVC